MSSAADTVDMARLHFMRGAVRLRSRHSAAKNYAFGCVHPIDHRRGRYEDLVRLDLICCGGMWERHCPGTRGGVNLVGATPANYRRRAPAGIEHETSLYDARKRRFKVGLANPTENVQTPAIANLVFGFTLSSVPQPIAESP
jgi:hypothetical protein